MREDLQVRRGDPCLVRVNGCQHRARVVMPDYGNGRISVQFDSNKFHHPVQVLPFEVQILLDERNEL